MKTKLFLGFAIIGILFASAVSAMPTLDVHNKADNGIINFTNNNSVDLIISDRPMINSDVDVPQDPFTNIINRSAPVAGSETVESPTFAKAIDFDLLNDSKLYSPDSADNLNAYTFIADSLEKKTTEARWDTNPGSPDAKLMHGGTIVVPAPGALLLAAIGVIIIGWLRKSRMLSLN
jgi:hypothetical protein